MLEVLNTHSMLGKASCSRLVQFLKIQGGVKHYFLVTIVGKTKYIVITDTLIISESRR